MTPLKMSVITACFNSQKTIGEAIGSLKRQRWSAIEHVVIDGASKDASAAIASHTLGEGDVIGFLNSDDLFAHDNVLSRVAACFTDPDVGAVYGDLQYVDADDTERVIRHWKSGTFSRRKLQRGWMPPHPSFFIPPNSSG